MASNQNNPAGDNNGFDLSAELTFDLNKGFDQLTTLVEKIGAAITSDTAITLDIEIANLQPIHPISCNVTHGDVWVGPNVYSAPGPPGRIDGSKTHLQGKFPLDADVQRFQLSKGVGHDYLEMYQIWHWEAAGGGSFKNFSKDIYLGARIAFNNPNDSWFTLLSDNDFSVSNLSQADRLSLLRDSYPPQVGWPHGVAQFVYFKNKRQVPTNYFKPSARVGTVSYLSGYGVAANMTRVSNNHWILRMLCYNDAKSVPSIKGFG